jgi:heme exporter protein D
MNWAKFFSMGGYAFYVWGSYGAALIVMGGEVIFLLRRKRILAARLGELSHSAEGDIHENKA